MDTITADALQGESSATAACSTPPPKASSVVKQQAAITRPTSKQRRSCMQRVAKCVYRGVQLGLSRTPDAVPCTCAVLSWAWEWSTLLMALHTNHGNPWVIQSSPGAF